MKWTNEGAHRAGLDGELEAELDMDVAARKPLVFRRGYSSELLGVV
jgi:hypothetical protein